MKSLRDVPDKVWMILMVLVFLNCWLYRPDAKIAELLTMFAGALLYAFKAKAEAPAESSITVTQTPNEKVTAATTGPA